MGIGNKVANNRSVGTRAARQFQRPSPVPSAQSGGRGLPPTRRKGASLAVSPRDKRGPENLKPSISNLDCPHLYVPQQVGSRPKHLHLPVSLVKSSPDDSNM